MKEKANPIAGTDGDKSYTPYVPTSKELTTIRSVLGTFEKMRGVMNKKYPYFNGRSLMEAVEDWMKRWNGYLPPSNPLIDQSQSKIFVNFTRNAIIAYLSKVALSDVKAVIKAVNKKTKITSKQFADALRDLKQHSENMENGTAKFLEEALECVTKGTVIVYEGYMKSTQKTKVVKEFDAVTGKTKEETLERTLFDGCYREVVPLEDFYIMNPYQPDVQKQPKVIWKRVTSYDEAEQEFGHYKNWECVVPGRYMVPGDTTTYYRNAMLANIAGDAVEILRYYDRSANKHVIMVNGVVLYDGVFPFRDGKYPFAKGINEPFAVDFFWGNGHPGKYMGEQDLINSFINMMADKTFASLSPTGLSSDLDDLVDDDYLEIGKIRKVSDVANWKWWESPGVNAGEQSMLQTILGLARESSATGASMGTTPRGGKLAARQILLQQQDTMQKMSFNMNFLEDLERDRTILRVNHILQFYAIPRIEKITGKRGKEIQNFVYRSIELQNAKLSDGRDGTRMIRLIGDEHTDPNERMKIADELSVMEAMGDEGGTPTEALAVSVDTFNDYNLEVEVLKNSSFEKNQALDQASRMEFANWRVSMAQLVPLKDPSALVRYVEEAFDINPDEIEGQGMQGGMPQMPSHPATGQQPGQPQQEGPLQKMAPSNTALNPQAPPVM